MVLSATAIKVFRNWTGTHLLLSKTRCQNKNRRGLACGLGIFVCFPKSDFSLAPGTSWVSAFILVLSLKPVQLGFQSWHRLLVAPCTALGCVQAGSPPGFPVTPAALAVTGIQHSVSRDCVRLEGLTLKHFQQVASQLFLLTSLFAVPSLTPSFQPLLLGLVCLCVGSAREQTAVTCAGTSVGTNCWTLPLPPPRAGSVPSPTRCCHQSCISACCIFVSAVLSWWGGLSAGVAQGQTNRSHCCLSEPHLMQQAGVGH